MIRGIRKVLRFQAKRAEFLVSAADALDRAVQPKTDIELNPRFASPDFHFAARRGIGNFADLAELASGTVQNKIVIVCCDSRNLGVALTDRSGFAEIEGCTV